MPVSFAQERSVYAAASGPQRGMAAGGFALNPVYFIFAAALVAGVAQIIFWPRIGFGAGYEMAAEARSLAFHGSFANPFEPAITGPTAANPPLYPLLIALALKLTRYAYLAILLANVIANAITAACLPGFARLLFGSRIPGVFAGILAVVSLRLMPQWDASFTLMSLVLFATVTMRASHRRLLGPGASAIAGLSAGLISLANPATVIVTSCWILLLGSNARWTKRVFIRNAALFAGMLAAANAPWVIRNYRIWHAPVLRTNLGMTLYVSNNDCATPGIADPVLTDCYHRHHPSGSDAEVQLLAQLGEVDYDRVRTASAVQWIRTHPLRFAQLTIARIWFFWFPRVLRPYCMSWALWLITALSVPGIFLMVRRRIPCSRAVLVLWAIFPLMYYVVVVDERYRYPILWSSLLAAGYFLTALLDFLTGRNATPARIENR